MISYKMGDSYLFSPYSKEDIWREEEVSCLRLSTDKAMHNARCTIIAELVVFFLRSEGFHFH